MGVDPAVSFLDSSRRSRLTLAQHEYLWPYGRWPRRHGLRLHRFVRGIFRIGRVNGRDFLHFAD